MTKILRPPTQAISYSIYGEVYGEVADVIAGESGRDRVARFDVAQDSVGKHATKALVRGIWRALVQ